MRLLKPILRRLLITPFAFGALGLGLSYLLGADERTHNGSFATARWVGSHINHDDPMWFWGCVFLSGFVCIIAAIVVDNMWGIFATLFLGGMLYTWWSAAFLISALLEPRASLGAWVAYGMIAFAHYAAAYLVVKFEVRKP